jgi:type I restriction-modification system DNA methylase subunit
VFIRVYLCYSILEGADMAIPQNVLSLVTLFERNKPQYKASGYKEAEVRDEFLNPFFQALGWDVGNKTGIEPHLKEVLVEESIKVEESKKAPDYTFRLDGQRKFFVEAKKPSVNLKDGSEPAFQLRRYSWSVKLPIGILTDFEEFAIYDCRLEPKRFEEAKIARLYYFTFDQFRENWDLLEGLFSKPAVQAGALDSYAAGLKDKKGVLTVDAAFLRDIEAWRKALALNVAQFNPKLSKDELNYAVQMIIDRIIFLRICEDREIEADNNLLRLIDSPKISNIYQEGLLPLFRQADERYNSGLFHFDRNEKGQSDNLDELTPKLIVGNDPLKEMIRKLYYPNSPYAFKVMPVEILGQVYEQFLGQVIVKKPEGVTIEQKPEVRKAGGVYYTPQYITDYIVRNTVGKLLEGKTPDEAAKLKVLDPSCGSGSFLLTAYQFLLDWYFAQFLVSPEAYHQSKKLIYLDGDWQLTLAAKKEILLNNIFGVDIDGQAVEVTKLSLLLKLLEGEKLYAQLEPVARNILPDLGNNIKCGNSLIGTDIDVPSEEMERINPFDWDGAGGFPEIMRSGGFDAVIGNPPYGAEFPVVVSDFIRKKFESFVWRGESYLVFIEKAVELLKQNGEFGFIIPDTYLNLGFTQAIRTFLLQNTLLNEVILLPSNVFIGATVDTSLVFATKSTKTDTYHNKNVRVKVFGKKSVIENVEFPKREFLINTSVWHTQNAFNVNSNPVEVETISRVKTSYKSISDYAEMFYGIKAYQVGKGKPPQTEEIRDKKPFTSIKKEDSSFLPFFDGKHIGRYKLFWNSDNWLKYGEWLAEPRKPEKYEGEKILIRKIVGETLIATYISETSYCNTLLFVLKLKSKVELAYLYLLGILNSQFIGWYFRKKFQISAEDTFPQIMIRDILQFPIPISDKARHAKMVELVERMLKLHQDFSSATLPNQKQLLERQIAATDKTIDDLVYELYELTPEEIKIVEGEPPPAPSP